MRCVCVDREGVSDIPVRLLIAAVLTSLVVPVFWSAYGDLSATITEGALDSELFELVSSVQDVMSGGVGSRVEVSIELKGWGSCDIERIEVGGMADPRSSESYLIRYVISGRAERRMAPQPLTVMTTEGGSTLVLSEGSFVISVTHMMMGTTHMATLGLEG
ncbi:MAG: hypothetical protein MUC62_02575 [Candidatus Thermoplasmatota archaeon]|jgi:hypothetical protein|nr:hypothetical protein [Candidatus Thermoplasmatota archaeon]